MEINKTGTKKINVGGLSLPNENTMIMNIIWYYFIRYCKKYDENQLPKTKKNMDNSFNQKQNLLEQSKT